METRPYCGKKGGYQLCGLPGGSAPSFWAATSQRLLLELALHPVFPPLPPGDVALPWETPRQSLEKERRSGLSAFNSPSGLSLALKVKLSHGVTSLFQFRETGCERCLRGCNPDQAFLAAMGGGREEREFGGAQGSRTLPAFLWLLEEVARLETSGISPLEACLVHFSVRDRGEKGALDSLE